MNPFYSLLAFDGLVALLTTVAVVHRNHVKRPVRKTESSKP